LFTPDSLDVPREVQEKIVTLCQYIKSQAAAALEHNLLGAEPVADADQTERGIHQRLMELGQVLMGEYFDGIGNGDQGYRAEFDGREFERKHRNRQNSYLTVFGPTSFRQCVYYRDGESLRPVEAIANLPERRISYFAQELMTRLGIEQTYANSQSFYADFFGYSLSPLTIEQVVQESGKVCEVYEHENVPMPDEPAGRIGVVSFDGKGIPVIPEARTTGKTREALLGCTYTIEPESRDARTLADSLVAPELLTEAEKQQVHRDSRAEHIRYHASVGSSKDELFGEVQQDAAARFAADTPVVCLMDGATVLWQLASRHFPDAVYILDLMHVLGYLRGAATALTKTEDEANNLLTAYLRTLLAGNVQGVIRSMQIRCGKNTFTRVKRKVVDAAITYFDNHADYMRYDQYLAAGYPVASGVIESACKHIAKNRMDKSGAQWSLPGADAVLKLRCVRATGHWHEFQQIRKESERNRLYQNKFKLAA
jgi:hypothetical protein